MTKINLLAWREAARARRNQRFGWQLLLASGAGLALIVVWIWLSQLWLDDQLERNRYLQQHVDQMAAEVAEIKSLKQKRERQLERVALIRSLQSQRSDLVALFDELAKATPAELYFTELNSRDGLLLVRGYAATNEAISALMRALERSEVFVGATLSRVDRDSRLGDNGSRFTLQVSATAVVERGGDQEPQR